MFLNQLHCWSLHIGWTWTSKFRSREMVVTGKTRHRALDTLPIPTSVKVNQWFRLIAFPDLTLPSLCFSNQISSINRKYRIRTWLRNIFDLVGQKEMNKFRKRLNFHVRILISRIIVCQNFSRRILSFLNGLNTWAIASKQPNVFGSPRASEQDEDKVVFHLLCFSMCHVLL